MPRGKLLRTKIKEAITDSQSTAYAIEVAKQKIDDKRPFSKKLEEHLFLMIDRIDPIEIIAILAMTYVSHEFVDWTSETFADLASRPITSFTSGSIFGTLTSGLGLSEEVHKFIKGLGDNPASWIVCFIASFYVIRHGKELSTSLLDVTKWFLAL